MKDKFGLPGKIIPSGLDKMLQDKDADKAKKAMQTMLETDKIDLNILKQASEK